MSANSVVTDDDVIKSYIFGDLDEQMTAQLEADPFRLHSSLVAVLQGVDAQLTMRKADADLYQNDCLASGNGKSDWFQYKAEYEEWRGRAVGFKRHVVAKLQHVKELRGAAKSQRHRHGKGERATKEGQDVIRAMRIVSGAVGRLTSVYEAAVEVLADDSDQNWDRLQEAVKEMGNFNGPE